MAKVTSDTAGTKFCFVDLVVPKDACTPDFEALRPLFEKVDFRGNDIAWVVNCRFESSWTWEPFQDVWAGLERCCGGRLDQVVGLKLDLSYEDTANEEEYRIALRDGQLSYSSKETVMVQGDAKVARAHWGQMFDGYSFAAPDGAYTKLDAGTICGPETFKSIADMWLFSRDLEDDEAFVEAFQDNKVDELLEKEASSGNLRSRLAACIYGDEELSKRVCDIVHDVVMAVIDDELLERKPYQVAFSDGDGPTCTNIVYANSSFVARAAYVRHHKWVGDSPKLMRADEVETYRRRGMPAYDANSFGELTRHEERKQEPRQGEGLGVR